MLKRYLCLFLSVILVLGILPVGASAGTVQGTLQASTEPVTPKGAAEELQYTVVELEEPLPHTRIPQRQPTKGESQLPYYGRTVLQALRKDFVTAYDRLLAALETTDYEDTLTVYIDDLTQAFSRAELYTLIDTFRRDHPEYFWITGTYWIYTYGGVICGFELEMSMDKAERTVAISKVEAVAEEILAGISEGMSDYQKELYLHDTLAAHITYVLDAENAHDLYGGLVNGEAVCDGYAKSLQYLLRKAGVQSYIAVGDGGGPHAWNYVLIDGQYYQVDLTWDDQGEELYHAYFNLTDARMGEDHTLDPELYTLPTCSSTDAFYFTGKPEYLDTYTTDSVGSIFVDRGVKVHVYVPGNISDFVAWYEGNIVPLAELAGVDGGFYYGYNLLGHELILTITTDNAAAVVSNGKMQQYSTLKEAIAACPDGGYVRLLQDGSNPGTLKKDLYVDLCGYDLSGVLTLNGHSFYGMDTTTNDYSCADMGTFNCKDRNKLPVAPQLVTETGEQMRYLAVLNPDSMSFTFHRFYLGITHVRLAPKVTGFGYLAQFRGDHMVWGRIRSVGYDLWINEEQVVSRDHGLTNSLSLILRNIDPVNYGSTPIHAAAAITLDSGKVIRGSTVSYTLRETVEAVNASYKTLTAEQLSLVKAMVAKYPAMQTWNIPYLK